MLALSADLGMDCSRHRFQLQDVGMDTIQEKHERAVVAFADWYSAPSIHRISHFAAWRGVTGREQLGTNRVKKTCRPSGLGSSARGVLSSGTRAASFFPCSTPRLFWRNDAQPPACVSSVARPT